MQFVFPQQERFVAQMNHVMGVLVKSEGRIRPHCHVTGSTGTGKSYLIGQIAEEHSLPLIEINAAQLTAEGLSGNSLSKALRPLREHWNEPNLVFVDEFDKLFSRNGERTEDFRSMVQDEFLTCLESKYASIFTDYGKYEPVRINNSMFIFAGSWMNQKIETLDALKDAGMRPEFLGRVPLVFHTQDVPLSELRKHIHELDLFKEYLKIHPEIKSRQKKAIDEIVEIIVRQQKEANIGIRLMNSAIHQYFMKDI